MKFWNEKEIAHTVDLLKNHAPEKEYEFALFMKNASGFIDGYLYKEGDTFFIKDGTALEGDFCRVDKARLLDTLFAGSIEELLEDSWVVD